MEAASSIKLSPRNTMRPAMRQASFRSLLLASIGLSCTLTSGSLAFSQTPSDPCAGASMNCPHPLDTRAINLQALNRTAPVRAIGLQMVAAKTAAPLPFNAESVVQSLNTDSQVQLASASTNETSTGVVNAVSTNGNRQPSLVKVPSIKVDSAPGLLPSSSPLSPTTDASVSKKLDASIGVGADSSNETLPTTSRSIGAKVRLGGESLVSESTPSTNAPALGSRSNSVNLKVTRSGDITSETPVTLNFNHEKVVALPAYPSPASPQAETGIDIPVRVEASLPNVPHMSPTIVETSTPDLVDSIRPTRPPQVPNPESNLPELPSVPSQDVPSADATGSLAASSGVTSSLGVQEKPAQNTAPKSTAVGLHEAASVVAAPMMMDLTADLPNSSDTTDDAEEVSNQSEEEVPAQLVGHAAPAMTLPTASDQMPPENASVTKLTGTGPMVTTGPLASSVEAIPSRHFKMDSQSLRSLRLEGSITRLHVVDNAVCRAITNDCQLFLFADQPGETLVEVLHSKSSEPVYVKVTVEKGWHRGRVGSVSLEQVQAIANHLAPNSDLEVQAREDGALVVKGTVETNAQAKKVMESVRKMVLVPVIDAIDLR